MAPEHQTFKDQANPPKKDGGFFSNLWSGIKLATSAAFGFAVSLAVTGVMMCIKPITWALNAAHSHWRTNKVTHTVTETTNPMLKRFDDFVNNFFYKTWGWGVSSITTPVAKAANHLDQSLHNREEIISRTGPAPDPGQPLEADPLQQQQAHEIHRL